MLKNKIFKTKWWQDGIIGAFIGFVNGFLGSGGGMIAVPMLEKFKKLDNKKAHATAIAVMFPFSLVSGAVYLFNFEFELIMLLVIAGAGTLGGVLGCFFLKKLSSKVIRVVFAVVMAFAGVWVLVA